MQEVASCMLLPREIEKYMLSLSEITFPVLEIFTVQVSKIGPFQGKNGLFWAKMAFFLSVILELFCLVTRNLHETSNLIGFIDSRLKNLL